MTVWVVLVVRGCVMGYVCMLFIECDRLHMVVL